MKDTEIAKLTRLIDGNPASRTVIDLDTDPFVPDGWSVVEHRKGGMLDFDPAKITLYLSEEQKGDKRIEGNKLREELKTQPVYNANLLDWYLRKGNQHLIPKEWKGKAVFFWGTIYRRPFGGLYVRSLDGYDLGWRWSPHGDGVGWRWSSHLLDHVWLSDGPAAVPAS